MYLSALRDLDLAGVRWEITELPTAAAAAMAAAAAAAEASAPPRNPSRRYSNPGQCTNARLFIGPGCCAAYCATVGGNGRGGRRTPNRYGRHATNDFRI